MTNKTISLEELKGLLVARVTEATSLRACARALGVSASYLSKVLITKNATIGPQLIKALGYQTITVYRKVDTRKPRTKGK
jgi:hypothetical protein